MARYEGQLRPGEFEPKDLPLHKLTSIDVLGNMLETLTFPVTKSRVIERFGKHEILWSAHETIMLEDIMREIPQDIFDTLEDLNSAICSTIRLAYGDYSASNQAVIIER